MNGIHAHLSKLRSDAAECLVLSNLAPEGKGMMFTRIAEHLNALALDIEKSATPIDLNSADIRKAEERTVLNATAPETTLPPRRTYARAGLFGLAVFALGALVGMTNLGGNAAQYRSMAPDNGQQPILEKASSQVMSDLIATEQAERKVLLDKVAALGGRLDKVDGKLEAFGGRMDNFDHKLDSLEKATSELAKMLTTATVNPEAKATGSGGVAAPGIGKSASTAENNAALDEPAQVKPADSIGPRGCTQFRSYDPQSGSYVTLDGRRRPCR